MYSIERSAGSSAHVLVLRGYRRQAPPQAQFIARAHDTGCMACQVRLRWGTSRAYRVCRRVLPRKTDCQGLHCLVRYRPCLSSSRSTLRLFAGRCRAIRTTADPPSSHTTHSLLNRTARRLSVAGRDESEPTKALPSAIARSAWVRSAATSASKSSLALRFPVDGAACHQLCSVPRRASTSAPSVS